MELMEDFYAPPGVFFFNYYFILSLMKIPLKSPWRELRHFHSIIILLRVQWDSRGPFCRLGRTVASVVDLRLQTEGPPLLTEEEEEEEEEEEREPAGIRALLSSRFADTWGQQNGFRVTGLPRTHADARRGGESARAN